MTTDCSINTELDMHDQNTERDQIRWSKILKQSTLEKTHTKEFYCQCFMHLLYEWAVPTDLIFFDHLVSRESRISFDIVVFNAERTKPNLVIDFSISSPQKTKAKFIEKMRVVGLTYGMIVYKSHYEIWHVSLDDESSHLMSISNQRSFLYDLGIIDENIEQLKSLGRQNLSNRRYLGCKTKLLSFIEETIQQTIPDFESIFDVFAGTGVVGGHFAQQGKSVIINDLLYCNFVMHKAYFSTESYNLKLMSQLINDWNQKTVKRANYYSKHFGNRYFSMENARKIGWIREQIERNYKTKVLNQREYYILLTSLLMACDKVANTVGHYDAFRENMTSVMPLQLRLISLNSWSMTQQHQIFNQSSNMLVRDQNIYSDIAYLDPPYNSRQYSDAYHVLENIAQHKRPKVFHKAKKMDRTHIKSEYCTAKAPEAFQDLIQNIKAKYIVVSYNSTEQKANARSNAKISKEQLQNILETKGEVEIFSKSYNLFTTGKTDIKDNEELLYVVKVGHLPKPTPSPLNYTGGKFKLLPQILPLFPKFLDQYTLIDGFCGGLNVSINLRAKNLICVDTNPVILGLYKVFQKYSYDYLEKAIEAIIIEYNLSDTRSHGYEYYGCNSSNGLGKYNKDNYKNLRNDYNQLDQPHHNFQKATYFYTLLIFGFNNQIRFNRWGKYNIPVGKRDFNDKNRKNLKEFCRRVSNLGNQISFYESSLMDLDLNEITNGKVFLYADPPYLISTATYNEQGGWTEEDERSLLNYLNKMDQDGHLFALSNVINHKGKVNEILINWSNTYNYNVHFLDKNYNNSNYQSKNNKSKTIEVLITNYT